MQHFLWIKWPSCAISCFSCVHKIKLILSQVLRGSTVCRIGVPFFFFNIQKQLSNMVIFWADVARPVGTWLGDQSECELVAGEVPVHLLGGKAHLCNVPNPSLPGALDYRAAALLWNLSIYSNAKVNVLFTCVWPVCLKKLNSPKINTLSCCFISVKQVKILFFHQSSASGSRH